MTLDKSIKIITINNDNKVLPKEINFKLNEDGFTYSMDCKVLGVNMNGEEKDCVIHSEKVSFPIVEHYVYGKDDNERPKTFFELYVED